MDGWLVTEPARTAIDLARTLPYEQGVAVADAALRGGLERAELEAALGRQERWPGWQVVRWVWADLDRPQVVAERVRRAFARARA